jgi:hypothetical protein
MVAGLVAIPRLPMRESKGAPRFSASLILAGVIGAINVLMQTPDNNSVFLSHKVSNQTPHHIIVGNAMHYGCEHVHGGIHKHLNNWPLCGILQDFEQPEVKLLHPDLPEKNLEYDDIVPANLDTTTNTETIPCALDGSIGASKPFDQRALYQQHPHVACKSTSSSSLIYMHGINVSNNVEM